MNVLPRYEQAVIPLEKFTEYALNHEKNRDKAVAFEQALGYHPGNVGVLIKNIRRNLVKFKAVAKGASGFGMRYEVIMTLTGENGKTANVLTAWMDDNETGEMRLVSAYVTKRKG